LSTHALGTSETPRSVRLLRHLDVLVLALALPVFVLAELSLTAYAVAAVAWLAQKALAMFLQRRADAATEPKVVVGLLMGGAMARGWLCALAVLALGLIDGRSGPPNAGFQATLLILLLFTVYLTIKFAEKGLSSL
jgi:hypothetical protein